MEIATKIVRVRPATIKKLNAEKKKYDRKVSHDQVICDAIEFRKKYKPVVE